MIKGVMLLISAVGFLVSYKTGASTDMILGTLGLGIFGIIGAIDKLGENK